MVTITPRANWFDGQNITESDMYLGLAPNISTSFTVPAIANLPMSPPEKNNGLTTKESVSFLSIIAKKTTLPTFG